MKAKLEQHGWKPGSRKEVVLDEGGGARQHWAYQESGVHSVGQLTIVVLKLNIVEWCASDNLFAISPQRLLAQQQRAQNQRSVPSGNRQQQDQQVDQILPCAVLSFVSVNSYHCHCERNLKFPLLK